MPPIQTRFLTFLAGILLFASCAAQDDFCETLKPKQLASLSYKGTDAGMDSAIWRDNERILRCANFDNLDAAFWRRSGFGIIIAPMLTARMGPVTYGEVLQKLDSLVRHPEYQRMKQAFISGDIPAGWSEPVPEPAPRQPYEFREFKSLNECLAAARDSNKRVLLYFSGYAAVQCRKMEERVLSDAAVKQRIDSGYQAYVLYTDDRKPMHPGTSDTTTFGDQAALLQVNVFDANTTPCFVLLAGKGKVLRKGFYMTEPAEFLDFLEGK